MNKNYQIKQTESLQISARWKDENGEPYVISKASFQVRPAFGIEVENTPIISLTEVEGIVLAAEGWIHVVANPDPAHPVGTFKYDLLVRRAVDSRQIVLLEGELSIEPGVSVIA